jgi:hypothetical protein
MDILECGGSKKSFDHPETKYKSKHRYVFEKSGCGDKKDGAGTGHRIKRIKRIDVMECQASA